MFAAHFTYFADIIENVEDITNADAVVLKITEKIKEPFKWEPNQEPNTFQCETRAMKHGEFRNEKIRCQDDKKIPPRFLTFLDIKLQVGKEIGYEMQVGCSCDSDYMLKAMDRVGKAIRESYHWIKIKEFF